MPAVPTSQFVLRVVAAEGDLGGPEAVEALARELRTELAEAGVARMDQVRAGEVPEGARGVELLGVCTFIITAVQAGEALAKVVATIRRVAARYARDRRPVRVSVGGVDVDLADGDDASARRVVQALLGLPAQSAGGVRRALIVANSRYDDARLARLRSPGRDAEALVRVLGDPAIGGFDVDMLMDADERTVRRRIAGFFADRDRDDLLLLHFSCHGVKDSRGRLHLAARDTDLSALGATSVPASFVHDVLDETQSRRVVLILDCCYSGAFTRGAAVRSGSDVQIADEFGTGSGRIVLTASSATEYAFEGDDLARADAQPSVFTGALVGGLQTGEADLDGDGEISVDELYDYTYRQVRQNTPGQAPMKWSFGVEGSLVVARSVRPAVLPESLLADLASDRVVLRLEAVRALAQLMRAGKPALRAAALATLADLNDTDDSVQVRRAAGAVLGGDDSTGSPAPEFRHGGTGAAGPDRGRTGAAEPGTGPSGPAGGRPGPAPTAVPPSHAGQAHAGQAAPAPRRTEVGRFDGLRIAGALLVVLSFLLNAAGLFGVAGAALADVWYDNLIYLVQLVAAVLLLVTRHARWEALLLGALAWTWVDLAPVVNSSVRDYFQQAWGFLVTADLIAIAAQLCLGFAVVRERAGGRRINRARAVAAVLIAPLTIGVSLLAATLLFEAWDLNPSEASGLRVAAAVICAAVLPVTVLDPSADRAASLVPIGWWLGAADVAFTVSVNFSTYGISDEELKRIAWLWTLVTMTAGAVLATHLVLNRRTPRSTPVRPAVR